MLQAFLAVGSQSGPLRLPGSPKQAVQTAGLRHGDHVDVLVECPRSVLAVLPTATDFEKNVLMCHNRYIGWEHPTNNVQNEEPVA